MIGRMRGMRPSYFQNGEIFDVEEATKLPIRLALLGLECWTDREGRFEWNPRVLKLNIMPYDSIDFGAVLEAMHKGNFVQRYEVAGRSFGIVNPELWRQQNINKNEAQSELPAPPPEVMRLFESGALAQGFHSYRDAVDSSTVQASAGEVIGANLHESANSLEVKGSELKGREEGQQHGEVGAVGSLEPEASLPAPQEAALTEIVAPAVKPAPLPAIQGKRTYAALLGRLAAVSTEILEGTRERLRKADLRIIQAELVFGYWIAKTGHEKAIFDPKRERLLIRHLTDNGGDVSELLYAIDGSLRDDHLQGRKPDSDRKYDGVETIFRDRAQVERLAGLVKAYREDKPHRMVEKYAQIMNAGGSDAAN